MYKYTKPDNMHYFLGDSSKNQFVDLLKDSWDHIHDNTDVFKYKINNLQEKVIDGNYLLQLNPDRGTKRRQPEKIDSVCQQFDPHKFNFNMVPTREMLFNIIRVGKESDIHVLIVNVSPITRYHTLLCPSLSKCYPQIVTKDSLDLALDIMFLAHDRDLRIGFNSLTGLASVNHLHYHLFIEPHTLPIENAKCKNLIGPLFYLVNYPTPGFCFEIPSEDLRKESVKQIYKLLQYFLNNSIAHNIFITRGKCFVPSRKSEIVRVVIWPRKSCAGLKQLTAFNVAICELSGWFPIFDATEYESLKTEKLEHELRRWKIDTFDVLYEEVKLLYQ